MGSGATRLRRQGHDSLLLIKVIVSCCVLCRIDMTPTTTQLHIPPPLFPHRDNPVKKADMPPKENAPHLTNRSRKQ